MTEHPHHQRMMTSYLPAILSRLEEAEQHGPQRHTAGEVRILARAPELIRPTNPIL
jgi:hypothetical protein